MIDHVDDASDFYDEKPKAGLVRHVGTVPRALLDRFFGWWFSRRWWRMLAGLLAILVLALILLPATLKGVTSSAAVSDRYKVAVRQALARNDAESADVYLRKLARLNAMDPEMRYVTAFVAQQRGEREQAKAILTELASGENGFPPAHLWMAKQLAADKTNWSGEKRKTLIGHLQAALRTDPPPLEANMMLGQLYLENKEYAAAIPFLEASLPQRPELHLSLGQLHLQLQDIPRANVELQQAAQYFQKRVEETPNDVNGRLAWALAHRLQNDFTNAKKILLVGLRSAPDNLQLRQVMASFCIDECDQLASADNQEVDKQLELLEAAIAFAPNYPAVLDRLAIFCSANGEAGDRARAKLQEALVAGKATATIHLILAIQAVVKGEAEKAAIHFEQGYQLNPNMPILLNNFAWLLAHQDKPELDRALTLVNRALDHMPNEPNIRETRGQIFVKLGRWREALADLEFALPHMSGNRELHASLSAIYHQLGDEEIAEKHKRLAEVKP